MTVEETVVCLLPARNAEQDLPGYLESVGRFADAVVALDDGSTDSTRELLEASPLVKVVLANPRRDSYRGWNDAANRNRLLAAAGQLKPQWIISLDADERIAPDDALALREFLQGDALPGFAYGFRVFRMCDGLERYDDASLWAYRLFAYAEGQRFGDRRLHDVPTPVSIPRSHWLNTTFRIQHLGGMNESRRRIRFEKYQEADPGNVFQATYDNVLFPSGNAKRWRTRPASTAALTPLGADGGFDAADLAELDLDGPVLSAIVISRDDEDRIEPAVRAVVEQQCDEPFEVIVVTSGSDRTAEIVRRKFPGVRLVELSRPALPGEARNAGLRIARGDYVSFPGSHVELSQGSLAARIRAHDLGYSMVTAATLNGTFSWAGWASYFLDHSMVLPGRPSQELRGPPAHCSYIRELLLQVGGFPEDMRAGEDTAVNLELTRRGYRAYLERESRLIHHSPCRGPLRLVRHHFRRGRGFGQILLRDRWNDRFQPRGSVTTAALRSRYVRARVSQTTANVKRWGGEFRRVYWLSYPLVLAGVVSALLGALYEIARARLAGHSAISSRLNSDKRAVTARGSEPTVILTGPATGRPEPPEPNSAGHGAEAGVGTRGTGPVGQAV